MADIVIRVSDLHQKTEPFPNVPSSIGEALLSPVKALNFFVCCRMPRLRFAFPRSVRFPA